MTTPVPTGQLIHIILVDVGGENMSTYKQDCTDDGTTTLFVVNVPYEYEQYLYVTG